MSDKVICLSGCSELSGILAVNRQTPVFSSFKSIFFLGSRIRFAEAETETPSAANTELSQAFSFRPAVGQNMAFHVMPTVRDVRLCNLYLLGPFNFIFPQILSKRKVIWVLTMTHSPLILGSEGPGGRGGKGTGGGTDRHVAVTEKERGEGKIIKVFGLLWQDSKV